MTKVLSRKWQSQLPGEGRSVLKNSVGERGRIRKEKIKIVDVITDIFIKGKEVKREWEQAWDHDAVSPTHVRTHPQTHTRARMHKQMETY